MTTPNAHKSAIREYQRANPGVTFPEARRATDRNQIPRVRIGESSGKPVWLDLGPGSVTPIVGPTGAGKRSTLRVIAAGVASARADVEVIYLTNRGGPASVAPGGAVRCDHHENPAVFLRTLVRERTAAESSSSSSLRPLVVVVDEMAPRDTDAVAFLSRTFRGLKMHVVLGGQWGHSVEDWVGDSGWTELLGHARTWVYVEFGRGRAFIGSVHPEGGTESARQFVRYDEASVGESPATGPYRS